MREKFIVRNLGSSDSGSSVIVFGVMYNTSLEELVIGGPKKFVSEMVEVAHEMFGRDFPGSVVEGSRMRLRCRCPEGIWKIGLEKLRASYNVVPVRRFNRLMR